MERKDYLLRYFELLGLVLARIMGFKQKGQYDEALEVIEDSYKEALNLDITDLDNCDPEMLLIEMNVNKKFSNDQLKFLAELLYERAELFLLQHKKEMAKMNFRKSLVLFEFIESSEKIFSIGQDEKIKKIRHLIE